MRSPEARLSSFVANVEYEDLPEGTVDTVQRAFVDTVGVTLAGSVEGAGAKAYRTAGITPNEADLGGLLGVGSEDQPTETALRLGTASHTLDDDLSWAMDGHPSVTLIPSLFAVVR